MSFWENETVLVTGAAGFVGSTLVADLLARGATVVTADVESVTLPDDEASGRNGLHEMQTDIRDREAVFSLFEEFDVELVYHLAAESIVSEVENDPIDGFESNVQGTWNVLEAARRSSTLTDGVVVASSDKAYGPHEDLPYTEDSELEPVSPYAVSKMAADRIAYSYGVTYDLPVSITRCSNIYGPGDRNFSRLIPETIRQCLEGNRPVIRSDGSPTRDYLYIDDAISAYRTLGQHTKSYRGEVFNFGTGTETTVLDVVTLVCSITGTSETEPIVLDRAEGEIHHQYVDSTKARERLGWSPETELEEGLRKTVPWYRSYLRE